MNILHINSYFNNGQFYKHLYDIERKEYDILVYVPVHRKENLQGKSHVDDKDIIVSKDFYKIDRLLFHYKEKKILKRIMKQVNIGNYDVIHAHSLFSNGFIAYKLHLKYDIPYIVAVRNTDLNFFFKKLFYLRKTGISILNNAEKVILLSDSYRELLEDNYLPDSCKEHIDKKITIIPNGIDPFWMKNRTNEIHPIKKRQLRILTAGEISENKNQGAVCNACEVLINMGFRVEYRIAGKIKSKTLFNSIKQKTYVSYLGKLNKEELIMEYRNADLFILLSRAETFGLVYAEAISQGTPIIYTRGQGFDTQFSDGHVGYAVNPDNTDEVVEKILLILSNYYKFCNSCNSAYKKFDWRLIGKEYSAIYEETINNVGCYS